MSSVSTRLTPTRISYEQFCRLPEDGNQYELIDGELVVTPSPNTRHQKILGKLFLLLSAYIEKRDLGEVYVSPLDTVFDPNNVLQPDILFISKARLADLARERIEGAPDVVVEILSPSTFHKDLRRKMAVYSQFGVQEYWIVDPEMKTLELHMRSASGLQLAHRFSANEIFKSPLLEGLQIPVASLFE